MGHSTSWQRTKGWHFVEEALNHILLLEQWTEDRPNIKARCQYEIWQPIPDCNWVSDITELIDLKLRALSIYKSQINLWPLARMVQGLNMFRAAQHNISGQFAEGFHRL